MNNQEEINKLLDSFECKLCGFRKCDQKHIHSVRYVCCSKCGVLYDFEVFFRLRITPSEQEESCPTPTSPNPTPATASESEKKDSLSQEKSAESPIPSGFPSIHQ